MQSQFTISLHYIGGNGEFLIRILQKRNSQQMYISIFLTIVMHIISATDFPLFCSKMPYSAGRMLVPKIAYSARNSAGRIYPSLRHRRSITPGNNRLLPGVIDRL